MNDKFCDLVCEGGGIKGIALLGAIYYLNEQGYEFKKIAGTSAGAIVASLLAVGYKGNELKDAIKNEIKQKQSNLKGQNISLGTTPRKITDLVGSLCDLTSGSGDKGTPVVLVQGYFDNLADD